MPVIGSFKQQPADTLDYDVDFSEWLPENDTVVSATVSATPATLGLSFAVQSPRVKVWCFEGANNTSYKVTVTATTNDSRVKQVEFKLRVKDD